MINDEKRCVLTDEHDRAKEKEPKREKWEDRKQRGRGSAVMRFVDDTNLSG